MPRDPSELTDRIRRLIERSELGVGERLGSERAIAEKFGVPRSALRESLEELEGASLIRRTMGRAGGVFVSDGKIDRQLNSLMGVPDLLRQQGYLSATVVLDEEQGPATAREQRVLGITAGDTVFRTRRRRDAAGIPLSIDSMSLSMRLVPGFQDHDHTGSIFRLLAREYRLEPAQADETIDVAAATAEQAEILGIAEGAALFEIWRTTFDASETPIEFSHDFFRADRTRISLRRYGARWKRAVSP